MAGQPEPESYFVSSTTRETTDALTVTLSDIHAEFVASHHAQVNHCAQYTHALVRFQVQIDFATLPTPIAPDQICAKAEHDQITAISQELNGAYGRKPSQLLEVVSLRTSGVLGCREQHCALAAHASVPQLPSASRVWPPQHCPHLTVSARDRLRCCRACFESSGAADLHSAGSGLQASPLSYDPPLC